MSAEIDRLEVKIQSSATKANQELDKLISKLGQVGNSLSSVNATGISRLASGVNDLSVAMKNMQSVRATDYSKVATGLNKLANVDSQALYKVGASIRNISNSVGNIGGGGSLQDITNLANAISRLGYKSTTNAITNLPLIAQAINQLMQTLSKAPVVSRNVIDLANSLANLASQGNKVGTATRSLNSATNSANANMQKYSNSVKTATTHTVSLHSQVVRLVAAFYTLKAVLGTLWTSIEKSMDYGETINLFQTAFKKIGTDAAAEAGYEMGSKAAENFSLGFVDEAEYFSEYISDALSLDPNTIMNYQAIFGQISNALGTTQHTAMKLSESFTMLGVDLASLFNDDVATSMEKLQSGLTGQVKPLRSYGIDITNATLQTYAYKYGIEDSVKTMTQAEKVQLRYLAIMDQASIAFGDSSKTINSSANQLRILNQQWSNLCRSIGNVFMPLIQTVLPYLNGLLIALRNITDALAKAMGYEVPDYTDTNINAYAGVTNDLLDVEETAEDAETSVKSLNKTLAKFDELNDIGRSNSGISGTTTDATGNYPGLDDAIDQSTMNYMTEFSNQLAQMSNKAKEIATEIQPKIEGFIEKIKELTPVFAGVATAFATYKIVTLFGGLATALAVFTTPAGIIALTVGALAGLGTAIYKCWKKAKENDLAERFGDITLSAEDLEEVATRIVDNGTLDDLKTAISAWDDLDTIQDDIDEAVKTLNKLNWKVSIGMELSESEQTEYKQAIQDYITNSQDYIEQQQLAVLMSIDLLIDDADTKARMSATATQFYTSAQGELDKLGKDLNDCVTTAWEDGLLEIDEAKEIQEIRSQMATVMEQIASSDFTAEMQMLQMDFSGAKLTAKDFGKLMERSQELVDEAIADYRDVTKNLLSSINSQENAVKIKLDTQLEAGEIKYDKYIEELNKSAKEFDAQRDAVELGRLSNIGEITLNATKFNLNTLLETFDSDLEGKASDFNDVLEDFINSYLTTDDIMYSPDAWNNFFTQITGAVKGGFDGLSGTAKSNLEDLLKQLEPTQTELENIANQYKAMGESVPQNISDGLTAITYLKAMTEDENAIKELIAASLNENDEYVQKIKTASDTLGINVPQWLADGMTNNSIYLTDSITSTVNTIDTTITSQTKNIKDSVETNGKQVNKKYADGIKKETSAELAAKHMVEEAQKEIDAKEHYEKVKASGEKFGQSFADGIKNKEREAELAATHLVEEAQKQASYEAYLNGQNVSNGYTNGIQSGTSQVSNSTKNLANTANNTFKNTMGIHSPSALYEKFASYTVDGYNNGIVANMGKTKSTISQWGNAISEAGSKMSIKPLDFQSNYSINTSGIEGYSNLFKNPNVTMRAVQSLNVNQNMSSLANLPSAIKNAVYEAITSVDIKATIGERDVFNATREQAREFYKQTGALPYPT